MKTVLTNADKAKRSLSFGSEQAVRPHSLFREVNDVRDDVERAFEKLEGKASFPKLLAVSGNVWDAGGTSSFVIYGENLLAGRSKASAYFASVATNTSLLITSVNTGLSQNGITVAVVAGTGALTIDVVDSAITITLADGGSAVDDVVDAINNDANAKLLVLATVDNNGASLLKAVAAKALTGGTGNGISVKISGLNGAGDGLISEDCPISSCSNTAISLVDGNASGMLANKLAVVSVTSHTVTDSIQFSVSLD